MARARFRLLLPVSMLAVIVTAACGRAPDGAAAGGRADTARQGAAPSAARDTAQARQAVLQLEEELFHSFARGDTAPSARILAADYVGVSGDGHRETKAQALANLHRDSTTTASAAIDPIHVDSTNVRVYGDAVVAQASGTYRRSNGGQSSSVGFQNTDVFVWRDGRWQLVATHLSKVAAPQGKAK